MPCCIDGPRRLLAQQPGLVDLVAGPRDLLAHHALLGQRLAERDPLLHPVDHQRQRPLGRAERAHAVVDAARAEPRLGDREPGALLAEQVRHRHPHVVEDDLAVPVLVLPAEHRRATAGSCTPGVSMGTSTIDCC